MYSPAARTPKLQLAVEQPSTGECWNSPKKRYPTFKDKEGVEIRWEEGSDYDKIKSHTCHVDDPQTGKQ